MVNGLLPLVLAMPVCLGKDQSSPHWQQEISHVPRGAAHRLDSDLDSFLCRLHTRSLDTLSSVPGMDALWKNTYLCETRKLHSQHS